MNIKEIIQRLRTVMDDARGEESHFQSWLIQNEGICDAIDALKELDNSQRTWVGLTEKDICEAAVKSQEGISPRDDTLRFAIAIEAKLKEKNT